MAGKRPKGGGASQPGNCPDAVQPAAPPTTHNDARRGLAERHSLYVEQTPLGYVEFTPALVITEWNPAAERMFGFARAEALGKNVFDLIVPKDVAPQIHAVHEALKTASGGERSSNENLTKDGRRIVCEWYNTSLRRADGQVIGIASLVQDVTASVQAERALVESEAKLRALVTNSHDAIGVSVHGVHTFANPAYVRLFGFTRAEELIGKPILEFIAPEAQADIIERLQRRAAGNPISNTYETIGLRRDGRRLELDVTVTSYPEKEVPQTVVLMRDVGERNENLRRLAASEHRFRTLTERSVDVVTLVDRHGLVVYHSPSYERVMGHKPSERQGQSMLDFVHEDDRAAVRDRFARLLAEGGASEAITVRSRDASGTWRWLELTAAAHFDDPAVAGLVINFRDVSERVRAEEERQKLERQMQHVQKLESLGVLAGGIAHDFNNILMSVLGHATLALAALPQTSPVRKDIVEVERAARRAAELTKQMLAYSGKGRFVVHAVDLRAVVHDMTQMLELSISKKAVLRLNLAPSIPTVLADLTQLHQVVMNLVINASEAIGNRSGVIAVSVGTMSCDRAYLAGTYLDEQLPEGDYVFLEVADNGCGMDKETLAKIFDPFFSTKFTGRGLGLAAVLGIIRGHRGAIRVYSEPGRGTTFTLLFPASEQRVEREEREEREDARPTRTQHWANGGTVLLVDDEETVRAVGEKMLQALGLTVITAVDGRDAVELFRKHADEIAAVLLDLTMPHMDGEETLRELRRIRPMVRVLLSSGYNEHEVEQRFAGKGLAGFVQKPYALSDLTAQLINVLGPGVKPQQ